MYFRATELQTPQSVCTLKDGRLGNQQSLLHVAPNQHLELAERVQRSNGGRISRHPWREEARKAGAFA